MIFPSYVSLPEGITYFFPGIFHSEPALPRFPPSATQWNAPRPLAGALEARVTSRLNAWGYEGCWILLRVKNNVYNKGCMQLFVE